MKPVILATVLAISSWSGAFGSIIYGIESTEGSAGGGFGSNVNSGSSSPARLFSFDLTNTTGSGLVVGPVITLEGDAIDVDGLSMSGSGLLYAFQIDGVTSRLVTIDSVTGGAAVVGTSGFVPRSLLGATFLADGTILAVDSLNNELVRISAVTGAVLSATQLKAGPNNYDVTNAVDIAMDANGHIYLVEGDRVTDIQGGTYSGAPSPGYYGTKIFQISLGTGAMTLISPDTAPPQRIAVGAAFTKDSPALATFEMEMADGVYAYTGPNFGTVIQLFGDVDGLMNSGRGDLASAPVATPEPSTIALMLSGAALLWVGRRRSV